jgi:hypothetical protein
MDDVIFLVLTAAFLAATIGLVHLFDHLKAHK